MLVFLLLLAWGWGTAQQYSNFLASTLKASWASVQVPGLQVFSCEGPGFEGGGCWV